jgi:hypothetical protein
VEVYGTVTETAPDAPPAQDFEDAGHRGLHDSIEIFVRSFVVAGVRTPFA